jgi:phosphoribosylformylglycinamidine synthase
LTPTESMAAKLPVPDGETATGTLMSFGYNPAIGKWSPFHGALYAVIESVAKIVATGGDYTRIRLTLQEYFEKLGKDPVRWGKPFAALLGAYYAQMRLGIPAIGGKDSMSGTFKELNVPPTLVSFALDTVDVSRVISPEFKAVGSRVVYLPLSRDEFDLPDFERLDRNYRKVKELNDAGKVLAAHSVRGGGIAAALSKMAFGNLIGFEFAEQISLDRLFAPDYGSLLLELSSRVDPAAWDGIESVLLGRTRAAAAISVNGSVIDLRRLLESWEAPLEPVFPTRTGPPAAAAPRTFAYQTPQAGKPRMTVAQPRVFIPVFPGTNCEYDTRCAFERAGAQVETLVFRNLTPADIEASMQAMVRAVDNAQMVMLPGGFSAGDEPDGSGKFIAAVFRNPRLEEAVMRLLKERDGLMLGICNGFQALIKLGLVPYGEIRKMAEKAPTLTFNTLGRHVSRLVRTRTVSTLSPWLAKQRLGDTHVIAVSHGEGRFVAASEQLKVMAANGQIATQYVDWDGNPTYDIRFNPNGSVEAIEGITSPDGRVFGKMGHSERIGTHVYQNVPGAKDQQLFRAGVEYFR